MKTFKPRLKSLIVSLIIISVLTILVLPINQCLANQQKGITDQMKNSVSQVNLPKGGDNPDTTALTIIGKLINAFISLFGVIFLLLMIYGGFKWMMASGKDEEVTKAKETIKAAITGLIIVLLAYAITYFITIILETTTR
jgi:ABC-type Fe3+ transport system permease subunit